MATEKKTKRLSKTLLGHHYELLAILERTSAHKLPGAMGALREDGVARFIANWVQKRYSVLTNVFAITRSGDEFEGELDLVIHDGNTGAVWKLDAEGGNSVVTWEEVKLIAQIKSTLDGKLFESACKDMRQVTKFSSDPKAKPPVTVLFSYRVADDFMPTLLEKFSSSDSGAFPFDAFILLGNGAYFADSLRDLRVGIEKGLSPSQVQDDGPSQDKLLVEDLVQSPAPNGYRGVSDVSPESTLLSLAALATLATSGEDVTRALLSACVHSEHIPIFEQ